MHSSLVRLQNVFGFFTTVAFTVAAFVAVSVLFFPQAPTASVSVRNVQVVKGRPHYYSNKREEYAVIKFDLDADLTSLFTWNTKQLFLWVSAVYPPLPFSTNPSTSSSTNSHNTSLSAPSRAIIWDHIISSPAQLSPPSPWAFLTSTNSAFPPSIRSKINSKTSKNKSKDKKPKKPAKKDPTKPDPDAEPGKISIRNVKPKYQITDISGFMAEREGVRLEVGWNVQPWVGGLVWSSSLSGSSSSDSAESSRETKKGGWLSKAAWKWKAMEGGVSEVFEFPALVGKKKKNEVPQTEDKVMGRGEVPRAGEATPVVEI